MVKEVIKQDKNCCANPPEPKMDEKTRLAIRKFLIGFIVALILGGLFVYVLRDAPVVRHLYMSPPEMKEHTR